MTSTSNSLDYSKIYTLREPWAKRPFRLVSRGVPIKGRSTRIAHGSEIPQLPVELDIYQGGQATDFLWSQDLFYVCISQRTVDLLSEHQITGWAPYPVELFDRKGNPLPGYHGFAVTGPVCDLDRSRSTLIEKPRMPGGTVLYQTYRGLYFNESQWDGSDMFWIDRCGQVVTDRVYQLFKRHKISNVKFTPLIEDERETGIGYN